MDWLHTIVFPYVNLALFLGLLYYFAKGPIRAFTSNRHLQYKARLDSALRERQEIEEKLRKVEERYASLDSDMSKMRDQIIREAKLDAEAIVAGSHSYAKKIEEETQRIIAQETERAQAQLKQQIVEMVTNSVIQKLSVSLTSSEGEKLVSNAISKIKDTTTRPSI